MSSPSRSRRLKLLALVDAIGITGGGEKFAREVTARIDPDRFERILCVSRAGEAPAEDAQVREAIEALRLAGVELIELNRRGAADLLAWRPVLRLLRSRQVDILHSHKFGSNVWGSLLSAAARTPAFIAHEQTWSFEGRPLRRLLDRRLIARRADAFVAVSELDRRRMIEVEGIDPALVAVVPNGIRPHEPSLSASEARRKLGVAADDRVIGVTAVLRPQKALHVMIEAVAALRPEFPRLRLALIGDGPDRPRLEALVRRLELEQAVVFAGLRPDARDLLPGIEITGLSSDYEGTPLAVIEYMAAGMPIVATSVGGVPDLIRDGEEALLVTPGRPREMAGAIARLLRDPQLAATLGEHALRRSEEFSIDAAARRLEALYERALAGEAAAGTTTRR